jgi:hypothetical protein
MTADNFDATINELTERQPFKVFVLELFGGTRYEIDHPRAIINQNGLAMFFRPGNKPVILDHNSVNQIYIATASELTAEAGA